MVTPTGIFSKIVSPVFLLPKIDNLQTPLVPQDRHQFCIVISTYYLSLQICWNQIIVNYLTLKYAFFNPQPPMTRFLTVKSFLTPLPLRYVTISTRH